MADESRSDIESRAAWAAVSAAFAALGRVFMCVDERFRVIHASVTLDDVLGNGAAARVEGRAVEEVLGQELFGSGGTLRAALAVGEKREGWRAELKLDHLEPRLMSISAAPFPRHLDVACDPRVRYILVLRPADQHDAVGEPMALGGIVARSQAMARIFALIQNLRHSDATILVTGESGTGKEVVARALHEHSTRKNEPFVAVNCGALPPDLLESEMFGHVRGAFTGAVRDRRGRFEVASKGTLFLDEIGDLSLPLQVKLLRALHDGTFERVGDSTTRKSQARIIAATNVDLLEAVRAGRFREDLYYRLRVVPIHVAPLRERREDIEPLTRVLLARTGARQGRALRLSPDALRALLEHDWPGNVRELENVLEYAVAVCRGQTIMIEDLPDLSASSPAPIVRPEVRTQGSTEGHRDHRVAARGNAEELRRVLDACHWNRAKAAGELGISRTTLWRRMREAGLA